MTTTYSTVLLSGATHSAAVAVSPIVFIVDHQQFMRDWCDRCVRSLGWQIRTFSEPKDFMDSPPILSPSCLVLNVSLPGVDVMEIQERIARDRPGMPIVLVIGAPALPTTLQARSDVLAVVAERHTCNERVLRAVASALARSQPVFDQWSYTSELRSRYASLTRREKQVMALVVSGRLNKIIGDKLGISEITVKRHRGRMMQKMRAASLPDLVTMAVSLGMTEPDQGSRGHRPVRAPAFEPGAHRVTQ